ncbi:MAG: hypothetical protein ABL953_08130 [Ilumatobacteraceae bacterium]
MIRDWRAAQEVAPFQLDSVSLRRQIATHEAGHAVIGDQCGFTLVEVRIGFEGWHASGGQIAGGCLWDAPDGDQSQLARMEPHKFALMALAGLNAERCLCNRVLMNAYEDDLKLLRIGLGWVGGEAAEMDQFHELLRECEALVEAHANEVAGVASALDTAGNLSLEAVRDAMLR